MVVFLLVVGVVYGDPTTPALVALAAGTVLLAASVHRRVREHPLASARRALTGACVCLAVFLDRPQGGVLAGLFVVLFALGTLVELYNYRHGTEHLRFA